MNLKFFWGGKFWHLATNVVRFLFFFITNSTNLAKYLENFVKLKK
jgi:hypothetical protein